jgi:hypothetical protein
MSACGAYVVNALYKLCWLVLLLTNFFAAVVRLSIRQMIEKIIAVGCGCFVNIAA